jgi:hypothetical protein
MKRNSSKFKTGQKINNFIIQERIINRIAKSGREYSRWRCLCDCVPCCSICNRAKGDLLFNVFWKWIDRIKNDKSHSN